MERNIVSTIKFGFGKVTFTVIEKISTFYVEIFNDVSDISKVNSFLDKSIKEVEKKIGGKISNVSVVLEPTETTEVKIFPHKQDLQIVGATVSKNDINNAIKLTNKKFETDERKVILVQPILFDVFDIMTKSYSKAPIGKKGTKLNITSMITTISIKTFDYISQVVKSKGVEIQQIMLSPQAISQNNLSSSALSSGSILIHIGKNQSFITINKNFATIKLMSIYDYGFKNLIAGIAKIFNCTKEEAQNILAIHGDFGKDSNNRVILSNQNTYQTEMFYESELNKIIEAFTSKLLSVANKFAIQNNVATLPIVLSGHITKIGSLLQYSKEKLDSEYISIYNPITFIEVNGYNKDALGVVNFIERIDEVLGRQLDTMVKTNPNCISSLKNNNSTSWLSRIIEKIGGKNVWK